MKTKQNRTKSCVAIFIPDKIDFKTKRHNKRQRRTQQIYFWVFI